MGAPCPIAQRPIAARWYARSVTSHAAGPPTLADQVKGLAEEVRDDAAHRAKASAAQAERAATIDGWLSRRRAVTVALILALPVLAILVVTTIRGESLVELFTPNPPPATSLQQAQVALDSLIGRIERFRSDYSELPSGLAEVGVPSRGEWTFTKTAGNQYQVVLRMYGQVVAFDSSQRKAAPVGRP
jgi:hypothetical protein